MFAKKRRVRVFYLVAISFFFLFIIERFFISFSSVVNGAASIFTYPVLFAQNTLVTPAKKFFERRKSRKQLHEALQIIKKENEELRQELVELRSLFLYHKDIEELIQFKRKYHTKSYVIAQIILRHISPSCHFFLIDKGSLHGVKRDMIAVHKNSLVGRVVELYPFYSKIVLITDKTCKVAAHCTKASGIHVGKNEEGYTKLEKVSHLSSVKEGDIVLSSGEGLVFPRGFALGCIQSAKQDDLFFDISVKPLISLHEMNYCMLLEKGNSEL